MDKRLLSQENIFNNLKILVFEHNENSKENLQSLFDLAKSFNDIKTIQKLANEFYFMKAIKYYEKFEHTKSYPDLIQLIIKNVDYKSLKKIIDQGVYINQKDTDGDTALVVAAKLNKIAIVKLLLKNNADVNIKLKNGNRLVDEIFELGYKDILNLLINYGANNVFEEYAIKFFHDIDKHITSKFVAQQFIYEELDAARFGNNEAVHFVNTSGVEEKLYINAMKKSLPEVDGAGSPQQILRFNCILPITTKNNQELVTKISILTVEKIMNKYYIGKYKDKISKLILDNDMIILIYTDHIMIEEEKFEKITEQKFYNVSREIYLELLNNAVKFSKKSYEVEEIKEDYYTVVSQEEILRFDTKHNPKRLVEILRNFTEDKPMKFTTHTWDFGELKNSKYKDFEGYIKAVYEQWLTIESDLKELSSNLYKKVYNFLWETDSSVALGWSSIDGLKEWCDSGKNPFEFDNFQDRVTAFKREIEIRKDTMLEDIFIQQRKFLGRKFKVELIKLKGQTFYTDTEKFTNAMSIIFSQMKERMEYSNIKVEMFGDATKEFVELHILQDASKSGSDAEVMLEEVSNGDFQGIKENLINLCDWSIESSFEGNNYRVNYLKSHGSQDIERVKEQPKGFTHILRFYNK